VKAFAKRPHSRARCGEGGKGTFRGDRGTWEREKDQNYIGGEGKSASLIKVKLGK